MYVTAAGAPRTKGKGAPLYALAYKERRCSISATPPSNYMIRGKIMSFSMFVNLITFAYLLFTGIIYHPEKNLSTVFFNFFKDFTKF